MHRWMRVAVVFTLAVGLVAAAPAATLAENGDEEFRVHILAGFPDEAPADTPFVVFHGWGVGPSENYAVGQFGFSLLIDGDDQGKGKFLNGGVHGEGALTRLWLWEYSDGFPAGTYDFTGTWWLPCSMAEDFGLPPQDCDTPNEPIESLVLTLTVEFVDP